MAKAKEFKIVISPGDGFHGCGINFSDLCEMTTSVSGRLYDAYDEYTNEYKMTGKMKKGGGLDKLIDCGDAIIEEVFGNFRLY